MTVPVQHNQQIMASSGSSAVTAVGLTSSVQLLPTASNAGSVSMPWMVPSYPMMVLQQGIPQSLFAPNVLTLPDGHVMLTPIDDQVISADAGSAAAQLNKPAKPQDQWLQMSTKTNSGKGVAEMCSPQQEIVNVGGGTQQIRNGSSQVVVTRSSPQQLPTTAKTDLPAQPKKPLTPYMLFSKSIWPHVKAANSHLSSVCEIGAIVGSLWRDLDPKEKQRYNDLFAKDKERYESELRTYLKTTGLNASDLAKQPKPKRNRDKPPTSWPTFSPSTTQSGIQSTVNSSSSTAQDGQASDLMPTFSQTWNGQMTQQLTAQQVLTQLSLSGQTLFANSDGSISVGGSQVPNLLSLPSQSLQLVSVTGEPVVTIYSDPSHSGVSQLGAVTTSTDSASNLDGSRPSWVWQQQPSVSSVATASQDGTDGAGASMVLYHLPTSGDTLGKVVELKSLLAHANQADSSSVRPVIPNMDQMQQFTVDQLGQLVCEAAADSSSREAKLEAELQQMSCALMEKAQEVSSLTDKLKEAYEIIERYKKLSGEATGNGGKIDALEASNDTTNGLDEAVDAANPTSVPEN